MSTFLPQALPWPVHYQHAGTLSVHKSPTAFEPQETYAEQRAETLSQNNNVTVKEFVLSCPVCRETIGVHFHDLHGFPDHHKHFIDY